ncbi:SDR family oxidoreductase [Candidatus Binatia bacterium]|nr:SDR family oxidoreductase [Candidatus Binatia bacterium]
MILVTGGAGYVGSLLVPELLAHGHAVRVVDTLWFGNPLPPHPQLDLIQADVRDANPAWLDGVRGVIHLAGLSNDPTADFAPRLNAESNVLATRRLAELVAQRASAEGREIRFLFGSSCSVYYTSTPEKEIDIKARDESMPVAPTANYSKAKRLAEIELLKLAEAVPEFCPVVLRKGTLFGLAPRMRFDLVVNVFTLHAWQKRQLTVFGSGEAWRPLLHVREAVDAYVYCLTSPAAKVRAQIFNVLHKNYRLLELAHWVTEILEEHRGVAVQVRRDRSVQSGERSYYVLGDKIQERLGFKTERGATRAVLEIWDALVAGQFGPAPQDDARYFNIRWMRQHAGEA